jgi:16S rRNA (cytosine1402-N4)-methyltransferase
MSNNNENEGMERYHLPVMPEESIHYLDCRDGMLYVDGTLGGGGHTELILKHTSPTGRVIGIDRDMDAIEAATKRNAIFMERFIPVHANFSEIREVLDGLGIESVNGILLDLGVSSHQLDDPTRGFSYQKNAPLDMRMDKSSELNAGYIVNNYSEVELAEIIWKYGEERFSKRIAREIIKRRNTKPFEETEELVEAIKSAIPAPARRTGPHPARRTFQALRIEVNGELEHLRKAIQSSFNCLASGGRMVVISFHSLEDRIVKQAFAAFENPCTCPPDSPVCICGKIKTGVVQTRKPVTASDLEQSENPRARSAKLRAIKKL